MSRPDVVATWSDQQVARRWLLLCPLRKDADSQAEEPSGFEINSIANDPQKLSEIRARLSDISWWMRLLSQTIAQRANRDDGEAIEKAGATPKSAAPMFKRLGIDAGAWCKLAGDFGRLFYTVAGLPVEIDSRRTRSGTHRHRASSKARELLTAIG